MGNVLAPHDKGVTACDGGVPHWYGQGPMRSK